MPSSNERGIRLKTIEGVFALMDSSGRALTPASDPDAITPYSNGYGLWFIDAHDQTTTKPLTAEEILDRIEAREKVEAQRG